MRYRWSPVGRRAQRELGFGRATRARTRQDDNVLDVLVLDVREQPRVLAHRVGRALEPLRAAGARRLRGSQDLRASGRQ